MTLREARWAYWRGPPELLAHVVRVAEQVAGSSGARSVRTVIDVTVDDDHEVFSSADEFVQRVTEDALRRFKSISVDVRSEEVHVGLRLSWKRPWWRPATNPDGDVVLNVTGPADAVDAGLARMTAAVKRGRTQQTEMLLPLTQLTAMVVLAAAFGGAAWSLSYLTDSNLLPELPISVAVVSAIGGLVFGTWLFPALEVVRPGQGHLARFTKAAAPPLLTLILAGAAKFLFE